MTAGKSRQNFRSGTPEHEMKRSDLKLVPIANARIRRYLLGVSLCAVFSLAGAADVPAQDLRTLTPDDLFKIEKIDDVAISPDGQSVAYVHNRPRLSAHVYQQTRLGGKDRADIWLAPLKGGSPVNITKGEPDGSGYWMPRWSPDGQRLGMLSTKGGDNVRIWVWEKSTGRLMKLADQGVLLTQKGPTFAWLDNHRLISFLLPNGEQPWQMSADRRGAQSAMREWPKAWKGRETTASTLESGVPANLGARPQLQLTILSIAGGKQSVGSMAYSTSVWVIQPGVPQYLSRDRQRIAFLKLIALPRPDPVKLIRWSDRIGYGGSRFQISIANASGRVAVRELEGVQFVVTDSFRWSPDSRNFAFIGVKKGDDENSFHMFFGSVDGSIRMVPLPGCDPRSLVWASGDHALVSAECSVSNSDAAATNRKDWWLVAPNASPRNLTEKLKTSPSDLVANPTGKAFVGVADGDVWRVNIQSGELVNLTQAFDPKIGGVAWPNNTVDSWRCFSHIVVSVPVGGLTDYYRIDLESGAVSPIARPSALAQLVTYHSDTDLALFTAEEPTGSYLTVVRGKDRRTLVEINTFLRDIAEGEPRKIEYRSLDGQNLKAWLILPPNYHPGERRPLVTWVYAGNIVGDRPSPLTRVNLDHLLNVQLLAARGYAVLLPSMPLRPLSDGKDNRGGDPLLELTEGVLPAVDKVIELGIADPQRLAVMGHSFGGFSTYGLVTQTNRFKAAIAMAGITDLISLYGTFWSMFRYESYAQEITFAQSREETGQDRMGNPPWKDLGRYLRNSPIFYVERVKTPLLIVHGDMDFFPIQQAEEFFTALYRLGKRAQFIRYWGEGHLLDSPANIRDMWMQTYAWLDEFCDISRDTKGNLVFDGDHVKSRRGAPALKPDDFSRFNEMELRLHPWVRKAAVGGQGVVSTTGNNSQYNRKQ